MIPDSDHGGAGAPRGYLSEQAKRSYTVLVGVLAVIALGAQFVVPMIVMIPALTAMTAEGFRQQDFCSGALWDGSLWFPEHDGGPPGERPTEGALMRVRLAPGSKPETVASHIPGDAVLLGGSDAIWILSIEGVSQYSGGAVRTVAVEGKPGRLTSPFLIDGRPAAVVARPAGYSIVILDAGSWKERWSVPSPYGGGDGGDLRAVAASGVVHLFLSLKHQIFYKPTGTSRSVPLDDTWEAVASTSGSWGALAVGGEPLVFTTPKDGTNGTVRVLHRSEDRWEPILETPAPTFSVATALFAGDAPGTICLASSGAFGSGRVVLMRDAHQVSDIRFGEAMFPTFFRRMMGGILGALTAVCLGFAIVLSVLMPRYRRTDYSTHAATVPFAPIWRRALAEIIDAVLLLGPLAWSYLSMFSGLGDLDASFSAAGMLSRFALMMAGFAWLGIGFLVFSWLEGRWGVTPGKLALGIRTVGTDLRPCGFGRAFLRNLLTFVDGFFYFLVGLILVALTENWQRVGDLVARTVVVRATTFEDHAIS